MSDQIQVFSDGAGIALIGDSRALDHFFAETHLPSRELNLARISGSLGQVGALAQGASGVAAGSGRWVKLTEESAAAMKSAHLMKGSTAGVSRAVTTQTNGKISGILEIITPGANVFNPVALASIGGMMAQASMQQSIDEINEYLAVIDEKVDDILRAQKDAVLSDMIGAGLILDQAMTVRDHVGRVSEVTWSTIQQAPMVLLQSQAYALRQLDAMAEKLEKKSSLPELAKSAKEVEPGVREWLAVVARTIQLRDMADLLALDHLLEVSPEEVEDHRLGFFAARGEQLQRIAASTDHLIARLDAIVTSANTKVVLHPKASRDAVNASNRIARTLAGLHELLGIELSRQEIEAKKWTEAVSEARDRAIESGSDGFNAAKQAGDEAVNRLLDAGSGFAGGLAEKLEQARAKRSPSRNDDADD